MITPEQFRDMALSLPGAKEKPHFDRTKFDRRIGFASLHEPTRSANLKLTLEQQADFATEYPGVIYAIPNGFGRMGWTTVELDKAEREVVWAGLLAAWEGAG